MSLSVRVPRLSLLQALFTGARWEHKFFYHNSTVSSPPPLLYSPPDSTESDCTLFVYKVAEVCVWLVHTSETPRLCWLQAVLMAVKLTWIRLETCGEFPRISPTWTIQALISIAQSIRQSTDNNEFGSGIFIDLKRVSDSVNDTMLWTSSLTIMELWKKSS